MRKISELAANALIKGFEFRQSNTEVTSDQCLYLHGHRIAWVDDGILKICLCNWNTLTTRERLNALPGVKLTVRKGELYLNGEKISSVDVYSID